MDFTQWLDAHAFHSSSKCMSLVKYGFEASVGPLVGRTVPISGQTLQEPGPTDYFSKPLLDVF